MACKMLRSARTRAGSGGRGGLGDRRGRQPREEGGVTDSPGVSMRADLPALPDKRT